MNNIFLVWIIWGRPRRWVAMRSALRHSRHPLPDMPLIPSNKRSSFQRRMAQHSSGLQIGTKGLPIDSLVRQWGNQISDRKRVPIYHSYHRQEQTEFNTCVWYCREVVKVETVLRRKGRTEKAKRNGQLVVPAARQWIPSLGAVHWQGRVSTTSRHLWTLLCGWIHGEGTRHIIIVDFKRQPRRLGKETEDLGPDSRSVGWTRNWFQGAVPFMWY